MRTSRTMTSAGPDLDLKRVTELRRQRPIRDKSHYCGNKSSAEVRRTSCPAFVKKCAKWKMSVILVSAQVLLVLTLGLWTLNFGLGLDNY